MSKKSLNEKGKNIRRLYGDDNNSSDEDGAQGFSYAPLQFHRYADFENEFRPSRRRPDEQLLEYETGKDDYQRGAEQRYGLQQDVYQRGHRERYDLQQDVYQRAPGQRYGPPKSAGKSPLDRLSSDLRKDLAIKDTRRLIHYT